MNIHDKETMDKIRQFYADNGIMPTLKEITGFLGRKSKGSAWKFVERMIKIDRIRKINGRIAPAGLFFVDEL